MREYKFNIKGDLFITGQKVEGLHSPTETFKDDVIKEIGSVQGTQVVKAINRVKIIDDTGTVQEVFDNPKIIDNSPTITFRVSYQATKSYKIAKVQLIAVVDSTEYVYFEYTLSSPVSVAPEYGVRIDYQITISLSAVTSDTSIDTSLSKLPYYLCKILIGQRKIGDVTYYLNFDSVDLYREGSSVASLSEVSRDYDTANNVATFKGQITPSSDITYDEVVIVMYSYNTSTNEVVTYNGVAIKLSSPDTLLTDVTYTFYIKISI